MFAFSSQTLYDSRTNIFPTAVTADGAFFFPVVVVCLACFAHPFAHASAVSGAVAADDDFLFYGRDMLAWFACSFAQASPVSDAATTDGDFFFFRLGILFLFGCSVAQASAVSDDRCPFPGLRCLRLETVGRAHYLCYTSRSSR